MIRTDIHRPTAIVPEDYDFVAMEHEPASGDVMGDAYIIMENRRAIRRHMEMTGGRYSHHEHGGVCGICGNANAIYTALFHHKPTNTYIRTGRECADKLDAGVNFDHFIRGVKNAVEAKAGKMKAQAVLAQHGLQECWVIFSTHEWDGGNRAKWEENTIQDIIGKLVKWGDISDKQIAFLGKLLDKIVTRGEREAARAVERAAALPVPVAETRMTVVGTVLTIRIDETDFGPARRMLVKTAEGWMVWGSVPRNIPCERGYKVKFNARVKRSDKDEKFGFFSRPTKAEVIEATEEVK